MRKPGRETAQVEGRAHESFSKDDKIQSQILLSTVSVSLKVII